MKIHLSLSFVLIVMFSNLAFSTEYLVRVDNFQDRSFHAVEVIENHTLIIADELDISRLVKGNIPYTILDENPRQKYYQIVYLWAEDVATVAQYGDIIDQFEDCVLLRTTEDRVFDLNKLRVELRRLTFDPIRFLSEDPAPIKVNSLAPDTLIQKMVAAVSQDSIQAAILRLQRMYTRYTTTDSNKIVAVNWIRNKLLSYNLDSVYFQYFSSNYGPNVVGVRKGYLYPTIKRYCLIGGHMDDVPSSGYAPGADDNASGTVAMLEAARVMKDYLFENTVYYVAFNAEELGLYGSDSFATRAYRNGDTIFGVLNYDMIGYVTPANPNRDTMNAHYTTAVPNCSLFVTQFFQAVADTYTQLKIRQVRNTGTSGSSDHASFWKRGYKALLGIERVLTPMYHTTGDTLGPHLYTNCGVNHLPFATQVIKTGVAALAKLAVPIHSGVVVEEQDAGESDKCISVFPSVGNRFVIRYHRENTDRAMILVYNALGQIVSNITYVKGNSVVWNGCRDNGDLLPAGVYFVAVKADNKLFVRRITLIR
ncbi:MAG: M20/M25/M40 family metallo-hydrolase [candidate division WOR-3 bacterium]